MENYTHTSTIEANTEHISPSRWLMWLRKLFFISMIIIFLLALMYLIYQNGKSIYANGI